MSIVFVEPEGGWVPCPTCKIEKEAQYLEEGKCPQCGTYLLDDPDNPANALTEEEMAEVAAVESAEAAATDAGIPASSGGKAKKGGSAVSSSTEEKPYVPRNDVEREAFEIAYTKPVATIDDDKDREIRHRILCRRRLMPFIRKFRPKYLPGWVHEDICQRLEQFVKDVEDGKEPRLLLMMPPRAGKSEIGSRHFPAWVLGKHPEWEIIAASHTSSLTMSFSRYVRDLVKDPVYGAIFSGTKLDPSSQSVENWNILGGGGYLAAGVGTGITGRGAHILLLDDLVKDIEAADSQTIRDNTWEWYASTAYTRLAPGGGVIGIMTWWHDDDWAGRIQQVMATGEGDKFEIIKYPAINDYGDEYILEARPHRPIQQFMPGHLPDEADKPRLVRVKDTAIHPARYTTAMMQRIKKNLYAAGQQRVWNALYQQNPAPDDGLFFTKEMFRYYSTAPERARCTVYQTWDFAITEGSENDYTVGTTIYQDERDALYVVDVRRFKSDDSFFIIDTILDYAREYDADLLGFEDGQIWKALQSLFDKRCDEREQYPAYEILKPLTDKMVRASPLRGRMQLGKVYFDEKAPWFRDLYHEMTRFPAGKHDDQIDSLAWGARLVLTRSAPRPLTTRQSKQPKSWKTKLNGIINGSVGATHMSA